MVHERPGDGLLIRSVQDAQDVAAFADLHARYVSAAEGITCRRLMEQHPSIGYDDFLVVEDAQTGQIVSTICLIPWELNFAGVPLRAAMLEMVVTHPDYRRRGLVRALIERFHQRAAERGADLCFIEGIPYYYRQFGYTYAIDHRSYDALPAAALSGAPDTRGAYTFRPAMIADAPALVTLYRQAMTAVECHTVRDAAYWRFLLEAARFPVRLIIHTRTGALVGYIAVLPPHASGGVTVLESAVSDDEAGLAGLRQLATEGGEIRLAWPESGALIRLARRLGSAAFPTYQWLFRIPDAPAFLLKLAPVFEARLAVSECAGLTGDLIINLFREALRLRFEAGRLAEAASAGFVDSSMGADGGDLCIPPDAFVRLVLGYRTLDELADAWPDIVIRPGRRRVLEILFPKISAFLCTPYFYLGPT